MNDVVIKLHKCLLVLSEVDIWNGLKPEILEKGIRQGKGYRRALRVEQYEQSKIYPTQEDINGNESPRAFNKNESEELK